MKLSIIICCYNEQATIADIITKTQAVDLGPDWDREILVIDNYSTDGTREILQQIHDPEIRTFFHERNMGKGMSIRTGIANMTGDYFFIQDADSEYDPFEQRKFTDLAAKTKAPAIFGSRVLGGEIKSKYWRTLMGNRLLTWLHNILFGHKLTDVATASKMVRADVAHSLNLTCTGFDLDFELPNKIALSGHDIIEIPIDYDPRTYAEGKKIGSKDAIEAIKTMLRNRLGLSPAIKEARQRPTINSQRSTIN
jgi:dolichol-phosphate mannosyltransferase